jgi:hypothetical protein
MGDLTDEMKRRLEQWRQNVLPVKKVELLRGAQRPKNYVSRRDYGDDLTLMRKDDERSS